MAVLAAKTPQNPFNPTPRHLPLRLRSRRANCINVSVVPKIPLSHTSKPFQIVSATNPIPDPIPAPTSSSSSLNTISADICRLCLRGKLEQALILLGSSSQVDVDEDAYVAVVRLCEWKRAAEEGSIVYSQIISSATSTATNLSLRLGNSLLSLFVRVGRLLQAWVVFGRMIERDLFSWNIMIGGYAKSGYSDEAMDLYHRMIWAGVRPDVFTFPCILRTCGAVSDICRGKEIHLHVLRFGFDSEIDVINSLITMYVKCGDVSDGLKVFDGMPIRDLITWNAMISGFFENKMFEDGFKLFLTMINETAINLDEMTMTSVISASESLDDNRFSKEIHGYAIKSNLASSVGVHNALMQMYSSFEDLFAVEKIFSSMATKDLVSWTTMISSYDKNNSPEDALKVYDKMKQSNVNPDEVVIASVLSACTALGRVDVGMELHNTARRFGLLRYVIVGNALIDMYSKSNRIDIALGIFHNMPLKDIISWGSIILGLRLNHRSCEALDYFRKMQVSLNPNLTSMIATLSACASIGALSSGKEIHGHALRSGSGFHGFLPNSILDLYVKCGRTRYAVTQFKFIGNRDVTSWNIMLTGFARWGAGTDAIDFFQEMEADPSVEPNEITFVSLLRACSKSGLVDAGRRFYDTMIEKYSIVPNLKHHACIVDMLGRSGQLNESYEFIKNMSPVVPDAPVWGALLNACRIHKAVELGELAAKKVFELNSESVGYYVLLCNLYVAADRWDEAARVRKIMRERGFLRFDPGCTWVEVKGKIHAFLSFDDSHPQTKEIDAVLNGLYRRMEEVNSGKKEEEMMVEERSKGDIICGHSERAAIGFALLNSVPGMPIWVTKNLYMCRSCHNIVKSISKIVRREITVRDTEIFHHFRDGSCSCGDEGF